MASKPKRTCSKPRCPNLTEGTYCDIHSQKRVDDRPSATQRGYGYAWRKSRLAYLKTNPLCKHCLEQDRVTPATDVDHIIRHEGDPELFWDPNNWQPLCKSCHSKKTAKEVGWCR